MGGQPVSGTVPAATRGIPSDLRYGAAFRRIKPYHDLIAVNERTGDPLTNTNLLTLLLRNSEVDILLKTLGTAFLPRTVTVLTTPTLIIAPNRTARGYIIINPSAATGLTTSVVAFVNAVRVPGTYLSAAQGVSNYLTVRAFLDVTAVVGAATLVINAQTRDPVSLNFAESQADIFGGAVAVGTYYANLGQLGVDEVFRLAAVVGVDNVTFSVGLILKDGLLGTGAGTPQTVFLGGPDVNIVHGYPLLEGAKETFYLRENTAIFGIAQSDPVILKVFELQ